MGEDGHSTRISYNGIFGIYLLRTSFVFFSIINFFKQNVDRGDPPIGLDSGVEVGQGLCLGRVLIITNRTLICFIGIHHYNETNISRRTKWAEAVLLFFRIIPVISVPIWFSFLSFVCISVIFHQVDSRFISSSCSVNPICAPDWILHQLDHPSQLHPITGLSRLGTFYSVTNVNFN